MSPPHKPLAGLKVVELGTLSPAINLKDTAGCEIVLKRVAAADLVIENFRPGVLEKLGLGWDALSAVNHGLVMPAYEQVMGASLAS